MTFRVPSCVGGGFKQGCVHGATDSFGYASVENVVNVQDLHATLLASLGLNHTWLAVPYDGRDTSLTEAVRLKAKVFSGRKGIQIVEHDPTFVSVNSSIQSRERRCNGVDFGVFE